MNPTTLPLRRLAEGRTISAPVAGSPTASSVSAKASAGASSGSAWTGSGSHVSDMKERADAPKGISGHVDASVRGPNCETCGRGTV